MREGRIQHFFCPHFHNCYFFSTNKVISCAPPGHREGGRDQAASEPLIHINFLSGLIWARPHTHTHAHTRPSNTLCAALPAAHVETFQPHNLNGNLLYASLPASRSFSLTHRMNTYSHVSLTGRHTVLVAESYS